MMLPLANNPRVMPWGIDGGVISSANTITWSYFHLSDEQANDHSSFIDNVPCVKK